MMSIPLSNLTEATMGNETDDPARYSPPAIASSSSSASARGIWITSQAQRLFSAYRRDEFADPDGFLAQLGMVFEDYPDPVIMAVTSPRTGIQRRIKWPPSIAEVVEACDAEMVAIETRARYAAMPAPEQRKLLGGTERRPNRGNLLVPKDNAMYAAAVEKADELSPDDWRHDEHGLGIWIPYFAWEAMRGRSKSKARHFTKADFDALPQEPV